MVFKSWLIALSVLVAVAVGAVYSPVHAAEKAAEAEDYLADDYLNERPAGVHDPIEGFNRGVFAFNRGFDTVLLRPVSKTYDFLIPKFGQRRVTDFLNNLNAPVVFLNSVLQGDSQNSFVSLWRFIINSSFGVFGLFDIATPFGMPMRHEEDFGQTLAVWGAGSGAYVMLPLFGPSNVRDALALPVDIFSNPFTYLFNLWVNIAWSGTQAVDTRTRLGQVIDQTYETSLDPYATFRSLYLQRRGALVLNQRVDPNSLEVK
jgi:phospholipid-binding lipoprotein MlaA